MINFVETDSKLVFDGVALEEGIYADSFSQAPHSFSKEVILESMNNFNGVPLTVEHNGKQVGTVDEVYATDTGFNIRGTVTCPTAMEYIKTHEKLGLSIECDAELDSDGYSISKLHDVKAVSIVRTPACSSCTINNAQVENTVIQHLALSKVEEPVSDETQEVPNETCECKVEEVPSESQINMSAPETTQEIINMEEKSTTELELALAAAQEALAAKEAEFTEYRASVDTQFKAMGEQISNINAYTENMKAAEEARLAQAQAQELEQRNMLAQELQTVTGLAMSAFDGMSMNSMSAMLEFAKKEKAPSMGNTNEGIMAQHEQIAMSADVKQLSKSERAQAVGFLVANLVTHESLII